jgi:hypothetical protein
MSKKKEKIFQTMQKIYEMLQNSANTIRRIFPHLAFSTFHIVCN